MQAVSSASSSTSHYHAPLTVTPTALLGQSAGPTFQVKQEQQDPSASSSRRHSVSHQVDRRLLEDEDSKLALAETLLHRDHEVILRPDLSCFKNAQDAVDRLLPYHVWNIPHSDLLSSLGLKEDPVLNDVRARKARRLDSAAATLPNSEMADALDEYGLPDQLADVAHPVFPSLAYAESLFARRSNLMERFKRTATALETTHKKAPISSVSLEHLERLAYLDDREQVLEQIDHLRSLKAHLEQVESKKGLQVGTYSHQIRLSFAITQEIEREREREREIERIKRQQERAAAKAAKLDKERETQRKLGIQTPVPYGSSLASTPAGTPGGYFSPAPARHGMSSYTTHSASNYSTGSPYGLPPTPTSASSSAFRPSGSYGSLSGPSTPSASANGMSALSGLTPGPPVHRGRGRPRKHPLPGTPGASAAELAKKKKDVPPRPSPSTLAQSMPASPAAMTASSTPSGDLSSTLPPTPVGPGSMNVRPPISTMHPTLTSATSLNNPRPSPSASASPAPSASAPALTTLSAAQAAVPQVLNASALSNAQTTKPAIPSHPIPLLIPVTSLPRLSALGIQPVPSPHIRPVVGPDGQPSGLSGLPATADPNQAAAAILLGITEGTTEAADGSKQQILHISVVLSKLNPTQLSGLAILMQSLQAQVEAEKTKGGSA